MAEFSLEEARSITDSIIFETTGKHLSDVEVSILEGAWLRKTYQDIALEQDYSTEYLRQDVGFKLWRKLSNVLEERVGMRNFKEALSRNSTMISDSQRKLEFPEGSVPLQSNFYIKSKLEPECYQQILQPGSLIRIKAPKLTGKTSLMNRIIYTERHNYKRVCLDIDSCNEQILKDLDKFLRWFCFQAGKQLNVENRLNELWDNQTLSSNDNCTIYFEYLLPQIDSPVVLSLDNVDRLFSYSEVIKDFSGLLRSWHELGKTSSIWQQVRLVMAYSTENYIPLDINQSPFNIGYPLELTEFDSQQVRKLAELHQLDWDDASVEALMNLVGGHPYLVRLALYKIKVESITLGQLIEHAPIEAGIYSDHLRRLWEILENASELAEAYKQTVTSVEPVMLNPKQIHQLHRLGLIEGQENQVRPRCHLYRLYFSRVL
jgi:hypothetical protein